VIFPDVTLEGTTVRRSDVDRGAELGSFDVDRALIGADTRLPR